MSDCLRCGSPVARRKGSKFCSELCRIRYRDARRVWPKQLTCASCSTPIYKRVTSLPQGQATCRSCRSAAAVAAAVARRAAAVADRFQDHMSVRIIWAFAGPAVAVGAVKACCHCFLPFETVTGEADCCEVCRR